MSSFVTCKTLKARKNHKCDACRETIPKGFLYERSFDVNCGEAFSCRWHTECRAEFDRVIRENDYEEMSADDVWENGLPDEIKRKYEVAK